MTHEEKGPKIVEESLEQPQSRIPDQEQVLEEEEFVPFVDKLIAFVLLAFPCSALLVFVDKWMSNYFTAKVTHIVLLIGIVTFLLSLGKAAKKIHEYRMKK